MNWVELRDHFHHQGCPHEHGVYKNDCPLCIEDLIMKARAVPFTDHDWYAVILEGAKRTGCQKRLSMHNIRHIADAVREALETDR